MNSRRPRRCLTLLCISGLALCTAANAPATIQSSENGDAAFGPNVDRLRIEEILFPRREASSLRSSPIRGNDLELGGFNESCIAVNPLNPQNIAYASLFELRVSTDGGATFAPPVPTTIPPTHLAQGDPSVAFDSQGRLFWSYLGSPGDVLSFVGIDVLIAQCNPMTGSILPGYPINVTEQIGVAATSGHGNDKAWLAADARVASPFRDRLYLAWTDFVTGMDETVLSTFSTDQGLSWSPPLTMGASGAFKWPCHVSVAPNGDVYAANHRQLAFLSGGNPNGISGRIVTFRSTDGGVSFPQQVNAVPDGGADMTFNIQNPGGIGEIPGAEFLLQGSVQPWLLPDPLVSGRVFVVYNDDPDNNPNTGDAANVYLVRSTNHGLTWSAPVRVDSGPGPSFQVMPTATIDQATGQIAVTWYDNRAGAMNAQGNFLLDVYAAVSLNGGASFGNDFRLSDTPFDPDAGSRCRYGCAGFLSGTWSESPSLAYAAGLAGVHRWNGSVWSTVATGHPAPFDVWGSSASRVWVVGGGGNIFMYNGSSWTSQASGTGQDFLAVHGRSATDVFAVGSGGVISHWDGFSWSPQASGTSETLFEVWALPGGTAWAVGLNGIVLRHDGTAWTPQLPGTTEDLLGVWASSDSDVWVAGQNGAILHWNGTWNTIASSVASLNTVWGTSPTNIYFGGFGSILHWNGSTLDQQSFSEFVITELYGSAANNIVGVGEGSSIGRFDGISWGPEDNPGMATDPTKRIGEYNGLGAGVVAVATWTGNTFDPSLEPLDQQSIFDKFGFTHQVGVDLALSPTSTVVLLQPGAPNPFRFITTIAYELPRSEDVAVSIHDTSGRLVARLEDGRRSEGRHFVTWNGRDGGGGTAASGVYFVRLDAGNESRSQKLVLQR